MFFSKAKWKPYQKNPISTIRKNSTDKIHVYDCGYFSKFLIEYKIEKERINIHKVNTWTLVGHMYVLFCSLLVPFTYLSPFFI